MELNDQTTILGLPQYLYYGQNERVDELNDRIATRHFPDSPLQPNFDPRSVPTKYSHFPIINRRTPLKEPVIPYLDYNQSVNFNPGTKCAPPSGYYNSIDLENQLRNQYFALQHGADQGVYIPGSNSDMYRVVVPSGSLQDPKTRSSALRSSELVVEKHSFSDQPFPDLFAQAQYATTANAVVENSGIGKDQLFNHTRTQLRGLQEP